MGSLDVYGQLHAKCTILEFPVNMLRMFIECFKILVFTKFLKKFVKKCFIMKDFYYYYKLYFCYSSKLTIVTKCIFSFLYEIFSEVFKYLHLLFITKILFILFQFMKIKDNNYISNCKITIQHHLLDILFKDY